MSKPKALNEKTVALSLSAASAVLSILCAAILLAFPWSMKFFASIFHGIDITQIAVPITAEGVVTGLVAIIIAAFVTGWLFAMIYNYFSKR